MIVVLTVQLLSRKVIRVVGRLGREMRIDLLEVIHLDVEEPLDYLAIREPRTDNVSGRTGSGVRLGNLGERDEFGQVLEVGVEAEMVKTIGEGLEGV